jgi:hypothetical protein
VRPLAVQTVGVVDVTEVTPLLDVVTTAENDWPATPESGRFEMTGVLGTILVTSSEYEPKPYEPPRESESHAVDPFAEIPVGPSILGSFSSVTTRVEIVIRDTSPPEAPYPSLLATHT